jgi:hypothetical protein
MLARDWKETRVQKMIELGVLSLNLNPNCESLGIFAERFIGPD